MRPVSADIAQSDNMSGFPVVTAACQRCPVTYGYAVLRRRCASLAESLVDFEHEDELR
jgi:hypothetical protein